MQLAEQFSDNSNICFGAMMLALNHAFKGDQRAGLTYGELALQKAVTPADQAWAGGFNSLALIRTGQSRRAIEVLAPMVDMQRAAGFVAGDFFAVWLGEAYWRWRSRARDRHAQQGSRHLRAMRDAVLSRLRSSTPRGGSAVVGEPGCRGAS